MNARARSFVLALAALAALAAMPARARAQDAPPAPAAAAPDVAPPPAAAPPTIPTRDPEPKADFQRVPRAGSWLTLSRPGVVEAILYGAERLDYLSDSTRSFSSASHTDRISLPGTYVGDHGQQFFSLNDSRWGVRVATTSSSRYALTAVAELGFGPPSSPGPGRPGLQARHLFIALQTPVVDVLVGRYHDLAGWGGRLPFVSTPASLGVPGELYRQRVQLRLSHVFRFEPVDFEIAIAGVDPVQRDASAREQQIGLRFAFKPWAGAADQNGGPPSVAPLQVGLSVVGRYLYAPEFSAMPSGTQRVTAGGAALDIFLPLYPAHGDDLANAASLTFQASRGTGIADLYSGLDGGARFPALANPQMQEPAPVLRVDAPQGIFTYDALGRPTTIDWKAVVLNGRYHLPFAQGRRVWVSATWSCLKSENLAILTPLAGRGSVYPEVRYRDVSLFVALWHGLQASASYQVTRERLFLGETAENRRVQLTVAYYF